MPPAAPVRPLPLGFFLCGAAALCFCMAVLIAMVGVELTGQPGAWVVAVRGAGMVLLSLGAITTEALWDGRPSAFAASAALAASYTAAMLALIVSNLHNLFPVLALLLVSAFAVLPMLKYIHTRSRQFWPRARVPAPRP